MFKYYYRIMKKFFELHATDKKLMAQLLFSAILRTGSLATLPYAAARIVDSVSLENYQQAFIDVAIFAVCAFTFVIFHHYNFWAYYKNANYIHNNLQVQILEKVVGLDEDYSSNISRATIINTGFDDVNTCHQVPDYFFDFFTKLAGVFIAATALIFVEPIIGIIAIILALISLLLFTYHMRRRDYYNDIQRMHQDNITGLYSQLIDGYREIHSFNMKEDLNGYLERYKEQWRRAYRKKRLHQDSADVLTPFILGFGRIVIYLLTVRLILNGDYGVSTLVLVIGYYENLQNNYGSAVEKVYNISKCSVAIERVHRLLGYKTKHMQKFGENNTDNIKGKIEFNNVSFTYGRQPLMKDVSFQIEPNSLVGIVGKSGSGKSTIFRLLLRLYKPTRGKIYLDDEDISSYTKKVYATNVSIVTQKPFIFDMTIRENLNLVDKNVEHQIEACKIAGIHNDIMKLEKGYDTSLVGDAANLSAGQKQLLALARTLLSKSEVLLFDEVTSALDADTSKQIIDILKKLKKNHTILVITHKPEIMRRMDELLVIDHGRLVGRGTHKNLKVANKYYQTLV